MTETEGKIMKKILIATTALVATASVAAAEVRLSGYARVGMQTTEGTAAVAATAGSAGYAAAAAAQAAAQTTYDTALAAGALTLADINALGLANANLAAETAPTTGSAAGADTTDVVSRFRLQADVSTTTDSGIGLNARQRFQTEEGGTGNGGNGVRFGVTYSGLAINFGNINGVIESAPNLYMSTNSAGIGLEGQSFSNVATNNAGGSWGWTAYSSGGAGANGVEVIYSANGLGLHVHDRDGSTGYGANYSINNVTLAAAREEFDNGNEISFASAGVALGMGKVALSWGDTNGVTKTVLAAGYNMAPGANVHAFIVIL
jgi:outer membrane protein OmpU